MAVTRHWWSTRSAETFAAMHATEVASQVRALLAELLLDEPAATMYEVVKDLAKSGALLRWWERSWWSTQARPGSGGCRRRRAGCRRLLPGVLSGVQFRACGLVAMSSGKPQTKRQYRNPRSLCWFVFPSRQERRKTGGQESGSSNAQEAEEGVWPDAQD